MPIQEYAAEAQWVGARDPGVRDVDLNPSEEQRQLIDTFAAFYAKECPIERVRDAEPSGHDPDLWARLCETEGRADPSLAPEPLRGVLDAG